MCFFWKIMFDFQVNYLMFIISEREGNFRLYVSAQEYDNQSVFSNKVDGYKQLTYNS